MLRKSALILALAVLFVGCVDSDPISPSTHVDPEESNEILHSVRLNTDGVTNVGARLTLEVLPGDTSITEYNMQALAEQIRLVEVETLKEVPFQLEVVVPPNSWDPGPEPEKGEDPGETNIYPGNDAIYHGFIHVQADDMSDAWHMLVVDEMPERFSPPSTFLAQNPAVGELAFRFHPYSAPELMAITVWAASSDGVDGIYVSYSITEEIVWEQDTLESLRPRHNDVPCDVARAYQGGKTLRSFAIFPCPLSTEAPNTIWLKTYNGAFSTPVELYGDGEVEVVLEPENLDRRITLDRDSPQP